MSDRITFIEPVEPGTNKDPNTIEVISVHPGRPGTSKSNSQKLSNKIGAYMRATSPNGQRIGTLDDKGRIQIWDVNSNLLLETVNGNYWYTTDIRFENNNTLALRLHPQMTEKTFSESITEKFISI